MRSLRRFAGFTTTGSSILSDVEALPKCMLFWRSFTHWVGGMGVLVFMLTILPMSGGYHMNLMRAESPGPSVERFVPTVKSTAKILYGIYICLSLLELLLLLVGKSRCLSPDSDLRYSGHRRFRYQE